MAEETAVLPRERGDRTRYDALMDVVRNRMTVRAFDHLRTATHICGKKE